MRNGFVRNTCCILFGLASLASAFELSAGILPQRQLQQWANGLQADFALGNVWDKPVAPENPQLGRYPVIVAVLDSGVDYTHEDLKDSIWINQTELNGQDNVDDDNNGCVDDVYGCDLRKGVRDKLGYYPGIGGAYYKKDRYLFADGIGHGSMVAGIIAAKGNNGVGIAGMSWSVKIMPIKVIYPYNVADMSDVARGIHYAVDNGAKIINASFGRSRVSAEDKAQLLEAIEYARQAGVLIIAAAGNNGVELTEQHNFYPAGIDADNILSVTAIDQSDQLWAAANRGVTVDVAAPGVAIYSTVPVGEATLFRKYYDPSGYQLCEGTSVAVPYVSGLAALIYSHYPTLDYQKIRQIILSSVDKLPNLDRQVSSGGKVNIYNALKMAGEL